MNTPAKHLRGTSMISSYIGKAYRIGQLCHIHPFVWNERFKRPDIQYPSGWPLICWGLNFVITLSYYAFVCVRVAQVQLDLGCPLPMKIYMGFALVYYSFPVLFQLEVLRHLDDFTLGAKFSMDYMEYIKDGTELENSWKIYLFGGLFFQLAFYSFNGMTILLGLLNLVNPTSPEFVSSVFLTGDESFVYALPFVFFQLYYEYIYHGLGWLLTYSVVTPTFNAYATHLELRSMLEKSVKCRQKFDWKRFLIEYRRSQFALNLCADICNQLVFFVITMVTLLSSICTFIALRMDGILGISIGFVGISITSFLMILITFYSNSFDWTSVQLLRYFFARIPKRIDAADVVGVRTVIRSLRPIQFN